jgi:hypothetical protein
MTVPTLELTNRFIQGLKNYDMTYDEITSTKWKYCGGNIGRHLNYYKLCWKGRTLPEHTNKCVCDHDIDENCYITDGETILILGNCCIKKFIPKSTRTCERCGAPHRARIVNRCDTCRLGTCDVCNKPCDRFYTKCYRCKFN